MNARTPAEVFPPGEFLKEELEARGWSQVELAEILARPPRLISEIIAGKRAITPETAQGLSAAFGQSPQYWMNLETTYQLAKTRAAEPSVTRRAKLYGKFPVKEMIKRSWIEFSESIDVLETRFFDFFCISSIDEEPAFAHAARKVHYTSDTIVQLAWLNRAQQVAKAVLVKKYSDQALRDAIFKLRACMEYTEEIKNVSTILAHAGVRFVVIEPLPGTKMDGACFWIDATSPVIALSLRLDRVDNFWFNLFHEIDHVLNGEGKENPICETIALEEKDLPPNEKRANEAAADHCIPRAEMEGFIARNNPMFTKQMIIGFAARLHIHPGIVAGQLQGRGLIPYSFHRDMLEKIRSVVSISVLTDGFGNRISL